MTNFSDMRLIRHDKLLRHETYQTSQTCQVYCSRWFGQLLNFDNSFKKDWFVMRILYIVVVHLLQYISWVHVKFIYVKSYIFVWNIECTGR